LASVSWFFASVRYSSLPVSTRLDAARLRLCGIVFGLALGVCLAVDRDPLLGHHAGAEPEPEAEEVRRDRVQVERAVRLRAVQEDRDRGDRDVRRDQGVATISQP
jgi:hypothetical protein